jgi:hypothetical protein
MPANVKNFYTALVQSHANQQPALFELRLSGLCLSGHVLVVDESLCDTSNLAKKPPSIKRRRRAPERLDLVNP